MYVAFNFNFFLVMLPPILQEGVREVLDVKGILIINVDVIKI